MQKSGFTLNDIKTLPSFLADLSADGRHESTPNVSFIAPDRALLEDAVLAMNMTKNLLLRGSTGSGKTKFAAALAEEFHLEMESINCSVDLDAESLLGFKTLTNEAGHNVIEFVEGPVVRAMREGRLLYIDEINMARPETLPILNGVLDHRRQLSNPFTAEVIFAHENFRVIAAINEGYVGTVPMNEALKNRFIVIDVPYLAGGALFSLLQAQTRLENVDLLRHFVNLSADLVTAAKLGEVSDDAASIRALIDACDFAAFIPPMRAVKRAIAAKLDDSREHEVVMNLAATYFGQPEV